MVISGRAVSVTAPRLIFRCRGVFRYGLALPRAEGTRQTMSVDNPVIDLGYRKPTCPPA